MRWFVTGGSGFVGRNLIRTLVARSDSVHALARNAASQAAVQALGATPVPGDLDDVAALARGMAGCDVAAHAAAEVKEWGPAADFERANIQGTANVIAAARQAGVKRLVHVGTEAPFATGKPIVDIDETAPFPEKPLPRYPATKAAAERLVRAANDADLATVVVRPRLIWGNDDTSLLPQLVAAVQAGRFMWIGGGAQLTSTCHVENVCEGIVLAATRGVPGAVYFLTDGPPIAVKPFLTSMLGSQGVTIPDKSLPVGVAWAAASACEGIWTLLGLSKPPPVSRIAVALIGVQVTVNDARARRELGYQGRVSREDGLQRMRKAAPGGRAAVH